MNKKKGFILSTYVYMLLVFFLLLLTTMLAVMNNTKLLSNKLKEQANNSLTDKDYSFILLGDKDIVLNKGDEYVEPGFRIQTFKGLDLSHLVSVLGNVDTNTPNTYKLTYSATYNGITKKITRNVTILDDNILNIPLVTHIQNLYSNETTRTENGLRKDNTVDENIRYSGGNDVVKNYVEFGNTGEIWRIIGIFEMKTSAGKTEELVKLVRETSIGGMSWDSSAVTVNSGWGINQWGASTYSDGSTYEGADLMRLLNGYYVGESGATCMYCNGTDQSTCTNDCTSTVTPINSTYKNMIENVVWNTGAMDGLSTTNVNDTTWVANPAIWYNSERSDVGKLCTLGDRCNDTVIRTTTWEGLVALPYATDWAYASSESVCLTNLWDGGKFQPMEFENGTCKKNNWMHKLIGPFYLSPFAGYANYASYIYGNGAAHISMCSDPNLVRPSLYLKSNVQVVDGNGSSTNPYKLKLN